MTDSVAIAERLYAALQEDDVTPFLEMCAADVVVEYPAHPSLTWGGRWEGRDGVAAFLDAHDVSEEILAFEVRRFVADGDLVIAIGHFSGRAKRTDREWSTPFVHLLTIQNGRLHRWEAHFDTAAAGAAHVDVN
jgi:uncharacterized protein